MVQVAFNHAGDIGSRDAGDGTFDVELHGHDLEEHCQVVLNVWLERTSEMAEIEPDEDDGEDWEVAETITFGDGRVVFQAKPYRGEDVWFTFMAPEA